MRNAIARFEDWGIDHTGHLIVASLVIALLSIALSVSVIIFGRGWLG